MIAPARHHSSADAPLTRTPRSEWLLTLREQRERDAALVLATAEKRHDRRRFDGAPLTGFGELTA